MLDSVRASRPLSDTSTIILLLRLLDQFIAFDQHVAFTFLVFWLLLVVAILFVLLDDLDHLRIDESLVVRQAEGVARENGSPRGVTCRRFILAVLSEDVLICAL